MMRTDWKKFQNSQWDMVIIGGGITGAGILREASRLGFKALLVEQRDFAWGTSSRSSKFVHGGVRYLKEGQFGMAYHSVRERQKLLHDSGGLVTPLNFYIPNYQGLPNQLLYKLALSIYDVMGGRWSHQYLSASEFSMITPHMRHDTLDGGFAFGDAQTDDARLVFRVLQEAEGATALNYCAAEKILRDEQGVSGVELFDCVANEHFSVQSRLVINATGAWVDKLREGESKAMRPLRGSHMIFPAWRFPVVQAITFAHPVDKRQVFVYPWEGATLVGTTDIDHEGDLNTEPRISKEELNYLLEAVNYQFPTLDLGLRDIISTYAGVRPVVGSGKADPSQESREHVLWLEEGLLTVTGGKLTTFRLIAQDALKAACRYLAKAVKFDEKMPIFEAVTLPEAAKNLPKAIQQRLLGRYGAKLTEMLAYCHSHEFSPIPNTFTLWAELRWAAAKEAVVHLDDLLLRRTRIGLLLPNGASQHFEQIKGIAMQELGWDEITWQHELERYRAICSRFYSLPD